MRILKIVAITAIAAVTLAVASCSSAPVEKGLLQGNVSIGPLTPVERQGQTTDVPCTVYQARKILVYKQNGTDLLDTVDIDCNGKYRVELNPGTYVIDINHAGIDRSSEVPATIEISANSTTNLDISIDTGIR